MFGLDKKLGDNFDVFFSIKGVLDEAKGYLAAHRRIPLLGEINERLISHVTGMLIQMDYEKTAPITLLIHSPGGDCEWGYHLQNAIGSLNSPVDGLVVGRAASMAVDILQMCRKRLALPNSRLYCHFVRIGFELVSDTDEFGMDEARALREKALYVKREREALYAKRTGLKIKDVQRLFRNGEVYKLDLSAEQALQRKLIDEIVHDFKLFPGKEAKNDRK